LQEFVRYIHLNPLRAGLVKDLKEISISPSAVRKSAVRGRRELDHAVIQGLLESL